jgi:putative hydrolase of the HAD superfamily
MIKAILFDIDNTLFPTDKFAELARRNAIDAMVEAGLNVNEERAYHKLCNIIKKYGSNHPRHFNLLLKEIGMKFNPKIIAAGVVAYHQTKTTILPYPDVPKTIISLRESGYKVCAASQGKALKQWDKLIRLGLHNLFHEVFVTNKKSKKFFKSILKKLKLKPQEVVMVGDNIKRDIEPAKELGIITILIVREHPEKRAKYSIKSMGELPKLIRRIDEDA